MIRYRPDSCKCIIILDTDGETFVEFESRCEMHESTSGSKVLAEIRRRNQGN